MWTRGEWVVPTNNGELYTDKPILYFWMVLIGAKVFGGLNEWTVRLPAALSALGLVLATYGLGREFFGARAGFLGAIVLGTTARVVWEARWAHTDMPFTFFFTLALYSWARAHFRRGKPREFLFAYGLMSVATLTKGFIGIVLPGLILLAYLGLSRDWRSILSWRLPAGAAIFFLIAAPWFAQVTLATDGRWLREFVLVQHIQRYTAGTGHEQPFYYYLVNFPADFLPWTIFLLPALLSYAPRRGAIKEPVTLFFCLWFGVIFLFFSISDTKRGLYLLPLFAPAALWIGDYFDRLIRGEFAQGAAYRGFAYLLFGLFCVLGLALPVAAWRLQPDALWLSFGAGPLLVGGGSAGLSAVWKRRPARVFGALALTVLSTMLAASLWLFPLIDQYKSLRPFALEAKRLVPETEPLYVYADTMNDFNYYAEREVLPILSSPAEVEREISRVAGAYLLIRDRDLKRTEFPADVKIIAKGRAGGKTWYLARLDRKS
jgi:4-amino-4-deoxy-L-arabinose transferase-like glycosyltransferase